MEMQQLEAIWADSSTQWNFDFEHRNEIQSNMNEAFNASSEQMFAMQVINLNKLLFHLMCCWIYCVDQISV